MIIFDSLVMSEKWNVFLFFSPLPLKHPESTYDYGEVILEMSFVSYN